MLEIERKWLLKPQSIEVLLSYLAQHNQFVCSPYINRITQWYSPTVVGKCTMRIRNIHTTHRNVGWSDRVVELYDKDRNYITFKSPTKFGLTVRNEFESLLALSNDERDELIVELEMDHTRVQKTRHYVEYSTPEGMFVLEIDEYANGTLVLEMESTSTAPLCPELIAVIDKEISGDAKFLNSNWKHMKTL